MQPKRTRKLIALPQKGFSHEIPTYGPWNSLGTEVLKGRCPSTNSSAIQMDPSEEFIILNAEAAQVRANVVGRDLLFCASEDDRPVAIQAFPYMMAGLDAVEIASPGKQELFPARHPDRAVISHGSVGVFELQFTHFRQLLRAKVKSLQGSLAVHKGLRIPR